VLSGLFRQHEGALLEEVALHQRAFGRFAGRPVGFNPAASLVVTIGGVP
jgi:hypothetical protein